MGTEPMRAGSESDELSKLMESLLATIARTTGAIAGAVRIPSIDGSELLMTGSFGLPQDAASSEHAVDRNCGVCGKSLREDEVASAAPNACRRRTDCDFFGNDCKEIVAIPLNYNGKQLGVFSLFFDNTCERSLDEFRSFGELLGIALENSRISQENRRKSMMAERQCMANEIHDSLAQTLIFARMRMSLLQKSIRCGNEELAAKYAVEVNEALGSSQRNVRELITHFRSRMDPLGLAHALQELVDGFTERTGIAIDYSNRVPNLDMPLEHEFQVFHIVREVLANIAAHSGATRASITVDRVSGNYVFTIEDNGSGLPKAVPLEGHYGLQIMQERAVRLGGKIEVESAHGLGTRIQLSFPHPTVMENTQ